MAAFDPPWISDLQMTPRRPGGDEASQTSGHGSDRSATPLVAAFSPTQPLASRPGQPRATVVVDRSSPLLLATPPTITRALALSHPFILSITYILSLLTWTSGDPWESFLMLAAFLLTTLYGDITITYAGPLIIATALISAMYFRRFSPLSSHAQVSELGNTATTTTRHQKSLDEIVNTMTLFTQKCNLAIEPLLSLTDFLSSQQTATSATTKPALTALFIRILFLTPIWIGLSLSPFGILTPRRVALFVGTIALSWHSRPARVTRTLLWRSRMMRRLAGLLTGLVFADANSLPAKKHASESNATLAALTKPFASSSTQGAGTSEPSRSRSGKPSLEGVRFTFVVYENQRRWLGLGWTSSMLAYERAAWTDEQLNPSESTATFELPKIPEGLAHWQWVPGGEWTCETGSGSSGSERPGAHTNGKIQAHSSIKDESPFQSEGWIYYDNKWTGGRRDQDGWGRYTRRRKWYRDAELVENDSATPSPTWPKTEADFPTNTIQVTESGTARQEQAIDGDDESIEGGTSVQQKPRRSLLFRRQSRRDSASTRSSSDFSGAMTLRNDQDELTPDVPHQVAGREWEVADEIKMGLG